MDRKTKWIAGAALTAAVIAGSAGAAMAAGADDAEKPITGAALEKVSAAALAHTGGGRVAATEVGDEEGYYEVEVVTGDGRQVDVHLDKNFKIIGAKADQEDEGTS